MTLNKLSCRLLNIGFILSIAFGLTLASCNKKDEENTTEDTYVSTESVAITAFSLMADARVMANLDSVFFSIDLEHGVVFNADSLPKGTNITKLIPKIKYPSSVKSAVIEMTGGTHRTGTVNYYSNSADTIDFTGKVTLTLGTADDAIMKTYVLKVNVHQQDPDTIYWDKMAQADLPSRLSDPVEQKSVAFGTGVLTLIEENDGSFTVSRTEDIFEGTWSKAVFSAGFTPKVRSLTATEQGTLYLLDDKGTLYSSGDGATWTTQSAGWNEIIGEYAATLLGTSLQNGSPEMISYPDSEYSGLALPADFPLTGFTSAIEFSSKWSPRPTVVIFGGYPYAANGKSPSWAFDGKQWVNIAENSMPSLSGMSVIRYYSYLKSASSGLLKEFDVYLAFGGRNSEGNLNNLIYVSYDHGINWQRAQEYMQLPSTIVPGYMVDAIPLGFSMESSLSNRWKVDARSKRRIPFEIDGDLIKWDCPYIFLFGGHDASGALDPRIRSGVLQRLTFEPLF